MYTFYIEEHEKNDATSFYIEIIKSAILKNNKEYREVSNVKLIKKNDIVIVITVKTFFLTWIRNPKQRIYIWFQGIIPEENMMMFKGYKKYIKYIYNTIFEKFAINNCEKAFFVSEAMYKHYNRKYGYKGNKHFIMPCFNQELDEKYFDDYKYQQPTFVYAGNLAQWQCVDKTLELFCKIKKCIPNAQITLLTKDKEKALKLAEKYDIKDIGIKYIPYTELNNEMSKYKYGFLLREDTAVNNVATPTKMSSYMACGVIPIFSDVIGDFKNVFNDIKYKISVSSDEECIETITNMEKERLKGADILDEFRKIFATYYSKDNYVNNIVKFLK